MENLEKAALIHSVGRENKEVPITYLEPSQHKYDGLRLVGEEVYKGKTSIRYWM